jgi:hypothetical protein
MESVDVFTHSLEASTPGPSQCDCVVSFVWNLDVVDWRWSILKVEIRTQALSPSLDVAPPPSTNRFFKLNRK